VSDDTAAVSPAPTTKAGAPDTMKPIATALAGSAAQYLGMTPVDVMTDLKAGKSLADLANARIDAAVAEGTLTADQAATAKQKLSAEIAKLVDRSGHQ
jgi:hypothetical protein